MILGENLNQWYMDHDFTSSALLRIPKNPTNPPIIYSRTLSSYPSSPSNPSAAKSAQSGMKIAFTAALLAVEILASKLWVGEAGNS